MSSTTPADSAKSSLRVIIPTPITVPSEAYDRVTVILTAPERYSVLLDGDAKIGQVWPSENAEGYWAFTEDGFLVEDGVSHVDAIARLVEFTLRSEEAAEDVVPPDYISLTTRVPVRIYKHREEDWYYVNAKTPDGESTCVGMIEKFDDTWNVQAAPAWSGVGYADTFSEAVDGLIRETIEVDASFTFRTSSA